MSAYGSSGSPSAYSGSSASAGGYDAVGQPAAQPQLPAAPDGSTYQQPYAADAASYQQPYGASQQAGYQGAAYAAGYPQAAPMAGAGKSKVAAGVLAILLGTFGIHNFYLGQTGKGVAQLLITVLSCGALAVVSSIWGIVEGILILTAAPGSQPWGVDANGYPLSS